MTRRGRDTPWVTLTRHFLQGLFRLSFLDDAGEESFKRAMIGVLAGILAFGLLLARVYVRKYIGLAMQPRPDLYRLMLPADQLLMIVLPMFAVALVMALVLHSLFPDDVDFQILMALPISRRSVFSAKAAAVFLFASIFMVTANVAVGIPFSVLSSGRWAEHALGARLVAQMTAGMFASVFTVAGLAAIQGLILVLSPRLWLRTITVITQTTLICALVLSMPIIGRVPALWSALREKPAWMFLVPPAWFLGVEQCLLGNPDPYFARLALTAIVGTLVALAIGASCYLAVYRRFDQLSLRAARGRQPWVWNVRLSWPWPRHPAHDAVRALTSATLRRSGLHQLVACGMLVAGFAMSVNSILLSVGLQERRIIQAAAGAPLTVIIAAVIGLRAAFLLPTNLCAAWIFRFTEEATSRPHQLDAVTHTLFMLGVVGPAAFAFPVQAAVLGVRTSLVGLPIVLLLGWVFVQIVATEWRRVPFTCTVLFGKRPAAYTLLLAFLAFNVFGLLGTSLLQVATSRPVAWIVVFGSLFLIGGGLRWHRLQSWGQLPLEFEDYLPDTFDVLHLQ
jgi:hypothetical protein